MGRHAKQNPIFDALIRLSQSNGVRKVALPILVSSLAFSAFKSCAEKKEDEPIMGETNTFEAAFLPTPDFKIAQMLSNMKEGKDLYYDILNKRLNTEGLVYQYFNTIFLNSNLSDTEKLTILSEMFEGKPKWLEELRRFIQGTDRGYNICFVNMQDVDKSNLDLVLNTNGLVDMIKKYSEMYRVPYELMISIVAANIENGTINYDNIMGIQAVWNSSLSKRTARNHMTGNDDNLVDQQRIYKQGAGENVKYACMIVSQLLKEANGSLDKALVYYYTGSPTMSQNKLLDSRSYKDTTLTYLLLYKGSDSVNLDYSYTIGGSTNQMRIVFEDSNLWVRTYNSIVQQLYAIEQAHSSGKNQ